MSTANVKIHNTNKVHFDDLMGGLFFISRNCLYMKCGNGNTGTAVCLENDGSAGVPTNEFNGLDVTPTTQVSINVNI
jgi:hypothetical protein